MSTIGADQEKIIRASLGIAKEITEVDILDRFEVAYLNKFKVNSDFDILDKLEFSWLPDASEPSQIENSTRHLENLILPTELRQKYRCFGSIRMGFEERNLTVQINHALKAIGATNAYIELTAGEFALVCNDRRREPKVGTETQLCDRMMGDTWTSGLQEIFSL